MKGTISVLRAFAAGFLLLLGAGTLRPALASSLSATRVVCGTVTASPTVLVAASPATFREVHLVNANTDYALIGDSSTSFSTSASTGTARLSTPASTAPRELEFDNFSGRLTCVGSGNGTPGSGTTGTVVDVWVLK